MNPIAYRVLHAQDLSRLYGLLAFFLPDADLETVIAAQQLDGVVEAGANIDDAEMAVYHAGIAILTNAHAILVSAPDQLRSHSAAIQSNA